MPPKACTWCNHRDSAAAEAAAADFHGMDGVNVIGAFQATPALLPLLRRHLGAGIVNVSAIAPVMGRGREERPLTLSAPTPPRPG
jgi:NAD(P)-dependent dehydrogenase (short-subunit alcohol dehydrogenase family)